jgi:hypothetical protein
MTEPELKGEGQKQKGWRKSRKKKNRRMEKDDKKIMWWGKGWKEKNRNRKDGGRVERRTEKMEAGWKDIERK